MRVNTEKVTLAYFCDNGTYIRRAQSIVGYLLYWKNYSIVKFFGISQYFESNCMINVPFRIFIYQVLML